MMNYQKYRRNPVIDYPERQWPGKEIEKEIVVDTFLITADNVEEYGTDGWQ